VHNRSNLFDSTREKTTPRLSPPLMARRTYQKGLPKAPNRKVWYYRTTTNQWKCVPQSVLDECEQLGQLSVNLQGLDVEKYPEGQEIIVGEDESKEPEKESVEETDEVVGAKIHRHKVKYGDTLQGICLRYGIPATKLRQYNHGFSGSNLNLAPAVLNIPLDPDATIVDRPSDDTVYEPSPEILMSQLIHDLRRQSNIQLAPTEARSYLELNDWCVPKAVADAQADAQFDRKVQRQLKQTEPPKPCLGGWLGRLLPGRKQRPAIAAAVEIVDDGDVMPATSKA